MAANIGANRSAALLAYRTLTSIKRFQFFEKPSDI